VTEEAVAAVLLERQDDVGNAEDTTAKAKKEHPVGCGADGEKESSSGGKIQGMGRRKKGRHRHGDKAKGGQPAPVVSKGREEAEQHQDDVGNAEDTAAKAKKEHPVGSEVDEVVMAAEKKPQKKNGNKEHVGEAAGDGTGKAAEKKHGKRPKNKGTQRIKGERKERGAKPHRRRKKQHTEGNGGGEGGGGKPHRKKKVVPTV
jgi:hypothetical protein